MRIEFDPAKDSTNQAKHGASLSVAVELDWEAALVWVDERFEYGETRMGLLSPRKTTFCIALHLWIEAKCAESSACAAPIVVR